MHPETMRDSRDTASALISRSSKEKSQRPSIPKRILNLRRNRSSKFGHKAHARGNASPYTMQTSRKVAIWRRQAHFLNRDAEFESFMVMITYISILQYPSCKRFNAQGSADQQASLRCLSKALLHFKSEAVRSYVSQYLKGQ